MLRHRIAWLSIVWACQAWGQEAPALTEKDYLDDVPVVLSVSRLPQRLDETPGAVTVIDRETIRLSGARDVADLLRLVPGFRVSNSFEGNAPSAGYHSIYLDNYTNHIQVLVDGRSVYSTYILGGTGSGLQTVALEDIERLEVLRGTGSAAYGARAFLGTINIVTRDPVETVGAYAHAAVGENEIGDGMLRIGGGDESGQYRLSVDQRGDRGLIGTTGPDVVTRVNLRADFQPSGADRFDVRLGSAVIDAGAGFFLDPGNAPRTRSIATSYAQLDWERSLGADSDLLLQLSHTAERVQDRYDYAPIPGVVFDYSGRADNESLLLQHSWRAGRGVRLVWGGELRHEVLVSRPMFDTETPRATDFGRVFGNLEWRLHPAWLLNAGALYERSAIARDGLSSRVMMNWHAMPGQTLRAGVAQGLRTPSALEKYGIIRHYDPTGTLLDSWIVASGRVQSEKVLAREVGYLGDFAAANLSVDIRAFKESVSDYILANPYPLADGALMDQTALDFYNGDHFTMCGLEYQLRWSPRPHARVMWTQSVVYSDQTTGITNTGEVPPLRSHGLMLMLDLPRAFEFSLSYYRFGMGIFPSRAELSPAYSRIDLRLGKSLRLGQHPAELSLVLQNASPDYVDFVPEHRFRRQAYVMLKVR